MKKESVAITHAPILFFFHTLLLIIYLSAVKTLICHRKMSLIGSTSFGFAQNTIHDFQKNGIQLIVALSSTNATKIIRTNTIGCDL